MPRKRITYQDIIDCQRQGMEILEIANKYGVAAYTVLQKIRKAEKQSQNEVSEIRKFDLTAPPSLPRSERPVPPHIPFDLRVGDIISAVEPEISHIRRRYRVIEIYRDIYIVETVPDGKQKATWKTSFRKADYKRSHDPGQVRLVSRREDKEI